MLVVSLKSMTATKEVVQTLEQLLCDSAHLEDEKNEVTYNRDTFQDLVCLMDQHRVDRALQLSILRSGDQTRGVLLGRGGSDGRTGKGGFRGGCRFTGMLIT